MTFVVTSNCHGCRYTDCVLVCPVDCFHGDQDMLYIDPDVCIDCGACEPECPNTAIYEGGVEWKIADGTNVKGSFTLMDGSVTAANSPHDPVAVDVYYISPDKCTECQGFHEEPQCAAVCPVDCCVDDPDHRETEEELLAKKEFLHGE